MRVSTSILLLTLPLGAGCALDRSSVATPVVQRHKFSNSTATVPVESLQVEGGLLVDPGDGFAVPVGVRWGASPATEFFAVGDAFLRNTNANESGIGDLTVGVRHRLWDESETFPAIAFEFSSKLPIADADDSLGTGEADLFFGAAADRTYQEAKFNAYTQLSFLGDPGGDGTDFAVLAAASAQRPVQRGIDVFGELAGLLSADRDLSALFVTGGALVALNSNMTLDAGLSVGFGDDAESLLFRVGVTRSLGRPRAIPINRTNKP